MDGHIPDGGVQRTGRLGAMEVLPPSAFVVYARGNHRRVETASGSIFAGPKTIESAWPIFAGSCKGEPACSGCVRSVAGHPGRQQTGDRIPAALPAAAQRLRTELFWRSACRAQRFPLAAARRSRCAIEAVQFPDADRLLRGARACSPWNAPGSRCVVFFSRPDVGTAGCLPRPL